MTDERKQALVAVCLADWLEMPSNFDDVAEHIEELSSLQGEEAKRQLNIFINNLDKYAKTTVEKIK